jgi:hypothetical protein
MNNESDLTRRLWNLGSAFRWIAKEIEEGRLMPGAGEAINFNGDPVCAFGWGLYEAARQNKDLGNLKQVIDNETAIINYLNDEMAVLPRPMLKHLKTVSGRVGSVNDPLVEEAEFKDEKIPSVGRKKIAASLRTVARACDRLMRESYKHDLLERRTQKRLAAEKKKEEEAEKGKILLKAFTTVAHREKLQKDFVKDRKEMIKAKEEIRELIEAER